jgi:hypothetical protein
MDYKRSTNEKFGLWLIALLTLVAVTVLVIHGAIPQSQSYHDFADQRTVWGIPRFFDVISNLSFVLVGLLGLYNSMVSKTITVARENKKNYHVFFIGLALLGVGSGYYHLTPSNASLVWDRIPITIAIMALSSIVLGEFVSTRLGAILLIPFVAIGILSVLYWYWSETTGNGDLRLYALVQFLPMIAIPIVLVFFNSVYTMTRGYWFLFSAYIIAKLCEHFDRGIYNFLGFVSGHTLKHLFAALGLYFLLLSFQRRHIV